jgi:hypothetical protein
MNGLPKGLKFFVNDDVTPIFGPLSDWHRTQIGKSNRKQMPMPRRHSSTAKVPLTFLDRNAMKRISFLQYSTDLPFVFYLFGHIKQLVTGHEFIHLGLLLQAINDISRVFKKSYWTARFSVGWIDYANVVQPVESMWSKQSFSVNRLSSHSLCAEILMGGWDTLCTID